MYAWSAILLHVPEGVPNVICKVPRLLGHMESTRRVPANIDKTPAVGKRIP